MKQSITPVESLDLDLLNKLLPFAIKGLSQNKQAIFAQILQSNNFLLCEPDYNQLPFPVAVKQQLLSFCQDPLKLVAELADDLNWLDKNDCQLIDSNHQNWKQTHFELKPAVHNFFLQGDSDSLSLPSIAIIGSRRANNQDNQLACRFAADLSEMGICIISGLAEGIDCSAHKGALLRNGKTIAVLGTGLNSYYPIHNKTLRQEIIKTGAIITQFAAKTTGKPYQFLQRNQLIASLADFVLVIAATYKSGSLSTANYALQLGKEVMAVPGSVSDNRHTGCHTLIQQGAHLIQNIQDVISIIENEFRERITHTKPTNSSTPANSKKVVLTDEVQAQVFQVLSAQALSTDQIGEITKLPIQSVINALISMQLSHLVYQHENGWTNS